MANTKKVLLVKGKAGMGNRILALLDSIIYAQSTGRKISVDWSDYTYSNDYSNVFPKFFVESMLPNLMQYSMEDILTYSSIFPLEWKGRLDKSVNDLIEILGVPSSKVHRKWPSHNYVCSIDLSKQNYAEDLVVRWAYLSEVHKLRRFIDDDFSFLNNMKNEELLKFIINKYLVLTKPLQNRVLEARPNFSSSRVIGVHVRFTDLRTDLKKYPIIIDKLLSKDAEASIYLATDNQEVELFFRNTYGEKIFTVDKWYPSDGSHIHQNPSCPDRFESGIQALTDIYLLASCDDLICDLNSSFAYVAKLLHNDSKGRIINISSWSEVRRLGRRMLDAVVHPNFQFF